MKRLLACIAALFVFIFCVYSLDRFFPLLIYPESLAVQGGSGDHNIYRFDLPFGRYTRLNPPEIESITPPHWSPDHKTIAYFYRKGKGESGIRLTDPAGKTDKVLLSLSANGSLFIDYLSASMAWSPDGKWIFFNGYKDYRVAFFLLEVGTGVVTQVDLAFPGQASSYPLFTFAWSPSEILILEYHGKLYRVDLQNRSVQYLVAGFSPAWQPDGERLAYVCRDGAAIGICTCTPDGSDQKLLFRKREPINSGIYWSPTGRFVYYMYATGESDPILIDYLDVKYGRFHRAYEGKSSGDTIFLELGR